MDKKSDDKKIIKTPQISYEPRGGIGNELFRSMKLHKSDVAQYIVETGEKDTYDSLLTRCIRTSLKLKSEGITRDDVVCLCTYNHINSTVPYIASQFLGLKVAALDPILSVNDTSYLLRQIKPSVIFLVPEALNLIESSINKAGIKSKLVVFGDSDKHQSFMEYLTPDEKETKFSPLPVSNKDTAVIFFSSGTTGLPKGICQSHYALLAQSKNLIDSGAITSVNLSYASIYWISTSLLVIGSNLIGSSIVVVKKFDPHQTWKLIDEFKVSLLILAPIQAVEICKAGRPEQVNTSSLLDVFTVGGSVSEKHLMLLRDLLPGTFVNQIYGQTEVGGALTYFKVNDVKDTLRLHYKPNSCGRPINGMWYKVVDPETEEILGPNQQGELRVKTKFVMTGYYNLDSSDAFDSEGWLKTGDVVYYDEDQCFYVVDRIKEMLKYRSWHIAPALLENILHNHPFVRKAVVIGIPHEEDGDHAMGVIILNNPEDVITPEEIQSYVDDQVEDFQRMRGGVKFVNSLPMTPSGKVKRNVLKEMILNGEI